ncbi:MAG: GNAT family N-acetyltransferase [Chloroflexota bacterium]
MQVAVRGAEAQDEPFLWEMLFEAAHMAEDGATSAESARRDPFLARYVAGWGQPGDVGVIAAEPESGRPVGAAWARLLEAVPGAASEEDASLPEVAVAVVPELRGRGVGAQLLAALLDAARPFYGALALSVRADNPARRLYERAGFAAVRTIVNRVGGTSLMMRADLLYDPAASLRLVEPDEAWRERLLVMAREHSLAGWDRYERALGDFEGWLRRTRDYAAERGQPAGLVPETFYCSAAGDTLVGVIRLRHRLSPALEEYGGHIGYDIRPSLRGRGLGTRQLALCLEQARARGLARVLVTCDDDNLVSVRVIEKNGGVLADKRFHAPTGKLVRRYWIEV